MAFKTEPEVDAGYNSTRAFTLVDLLVVLAIIALLAGLLFPVFSAAKKKSQGALCLSNLRQYGTAVGMYCSDYDDHMPFAPDALERYVDFSGTFPPSDLLDMLRATIPYDVSYILHPYGTVAEIFHCPLDQNYLYETEPGHQPTFFAECGSSYWYDDAHALLGQTLGGYPTPSQNIIVHEYGFYHGGAWVGDGLENVLFADFHVKLTTGDVVNDLMHQYP